MGFNYPIGPLFPKKPGSNEPNIIFSSDLEYNQSTNSIESVKGTDQNSKGAINTALTITTKPFEVKGLKNYLTGFFEEQVNVQDYLTGDLGKKDLYTEGNYGNLTDLETALSSKKPDGSAISAAFQDTGWYMYWAKLVASLGIKQYQNTPRNELLGAARWLGYTGPWHDDWSKTGTQSSEDGQSINLSENGVIGDALYNQLILAENYNTEGMFNKYNSLDASQSDLLHSEYNKDDLQIIIDEIKQGKSQSDASRIWYGSLTYSYGLVDKSGQVTPSFPGPVLVTKRDDDINIKFDNQIEIFQTDEYGEDRALELNAYATGVSNKTGGHSGSDGHAGNTSTNIHLHGAHTHPGGFSDNIIARYSTGQHWETKFELAKQHGEGSYWYHPHYHPSVNQQVYAGMSGPIQIGNPLGHVPGFEDVPRNLAVLKSNNVKIDPETGEAKISYIPNGYNVVSNNMALVTVNGEYQPEAKATEPGWQAIALNNQTGQAFYNIQFNHKIGESNAESDFTVLPMYVYGEDGWQYPQIQRAEGTLGSSPLNDKEPKQYYANLEDTLTIAPGKRFDVLVYLPEGRTEMSSIMNFTKTVDGESQPQNFVIDNIGKYPFQTSWEPNPKTTSFTKGFGALAAFEVSAGTSNTTPLSVQEQSEAIDQANRNTPIIEITPKNDNTKNAVQRIRYFANEQQQPLWQPIRRRQSHWVQNALVGPKSEWDRYTTDIINNLPTKDVDGVATPGSYSRYQTLTGANNLGPKLPAKTNLTEWLSYDNPFLINDSLFPFAPITITQLETVEEWDLWNYSKNFFNNKKSYPAPPLAGSYQKYVAHPFHIHINDYQVKDRDSAMNYRESLQDVSPLNSSGYAYYLENTSVDETVEKNNIDNIISKPPLKGDLLVLDPALDSESISSMNVSAANSQTVRMAFEDFKGVYVYHCHILPHEDQGMMIALMVVDNTDSSWIAPSLIIDREGELDDNLYNYSVDAYLAQDLKPYTATFSSQQETIDLLTLSNGDLNRDGIQDLAIGSSGDGMIRIIDGKELLENNKSDELWQFTPFRSDEAPWIFANDFNGDQHYEIVTAGFETKPGKQINLDQLSLKGFTLDKKEPALEFEFNPYEFIQCDLDSTKPVSNLSRSDLSVAYADTNVDNFNDIVLAYRVDEGVRVSVIDGASLALKIQTGEFEGGYNPLSDLLADAIVKSDELSNASQINLEIGWNNYGQGALSNILLSGTNGKSTSVYEMQVQAGHYIASSLYEPFHLESEDGVEQVSCDTKENSVVPSSDLDGTSQSMFETKKEAEAAAPNFGCSGAHQMGDMWMVCSDHASETTESKDSHEHHHGGSHSGHATFSLTLLKKNTLKTNLSAISKDAAFVGALANTTTTFWHDGDDPTLLIPQGNDYNGRGVTGGSKNILRSKNELPIKVNSLSLDAIDSDFLKTKPNDAQARVDQANLLQLIYSGEISNPTVTAILSASKKMTNGDSAGLIDLLLESGETAQIESNFGASLNSLDANKVVKKVFNTLFGKKPSDKKIDQFLDEINQDNNQMLPYEILTQWNFNDNELLSLNYLAAGMNWSNVQLGYQANYKGSFAIGLNPQQNNFNLFNNTLLDDTNYASLADAQAAFEAYKENSIMKLKGTRITDASATEQLVATNQKQLNGGSGRDQLVGSKADNSMYGNRGADVLIGHGGSNLYNGGPGRDLARFGDENNSVDLRLDTPQSTGNGLDLFESIESLDGEGGDDNLHGNNARNDLYGRDGNDQLYGYDKKDRLKGGAGSDTLDGGSGNDTINGGSGPDILVASTGHDKVNDFEIGQDVIHIESGQSKPGPDYNFASQGNDLRISFGSDSSMLLKNINLLDFVAATPNPIQVI